jgi:hypothetical protein
MSSEPSSQHRVSTGAFSYDTELLRFQVSHSRTHSGLHRSPTSGCMPMSRAHLGGSGVSRGLRCGRWKSRSGHPSTGPRRSRGDLGGQRGMEVGPAKHHTRLYWNGLRIPICERWQLLVVPIPRFRRQILNRAMHGQSRSGKSPVVSSVAKEERSGRQGNDPGQELRARIKPRAVQGVHYDKVSVVRVERPARFHQVAGYVRAEHATNVELHVKGAGHGKSNAICRHGHTRRSHRGRACRRARGSLPRHAPQPRGRCRQAHQEPWRPW